MAKYVLISDTTLTRAYGNFPLLQFLPAAPSDLVPKPVYDFLRGRAEASLPNGEAAYTSYSVRKIEATLLTRNRREDVAVPHEKYLERFIDDDTEVIAVSTMDPLGYSPLALSFHLLFGGAKKPWACVEWERLISRINRARAGRRAKLVVGGPGVWEFMTDPASLEKEGIDYAIQGETEDILCDLFEQISSGGPDGNRFFKGFMTFDGKFHRSYVPNDRFITRRPGSQKGAPAVEDIPPIVRPSMLGIVEAMRGCGVGCDFCEVTLRPLRYFPVKQIVQEARVNANSGYGHVWLHSDEIFAYKHPNARYEPNEEALAELFSALVSVPGVSGVNPTHGRISIPAEYPRLIERLSGILRAGPENWIGLQVGVETGSDRLALKHTPNKTLPLRIGPDGTFAEIVHKGIYNLNRNFWRPALTVQVGQAEETPEDNWDTVALINRLSDSKVDGRPFEFTVTPMQNVPLGLIKNREMKASMLDESQIAVYYASYRHLAKIASRDAAGESRGGFLKRAGMSTLIPLGGWGMMKIVEGIAKKYKVDIEKVKRYGLEDARK